MAILGFLLLISMIRQEIKPTWSGTLTDTGRNQRTQLHPEITLDGPNDRGCDTFTWRKWHTETDISEESRIRVAVVKDRATAPLNNKTRGLQQPHTSPAVWSKAQTMNPTHEKSEKGKIRRNMAKTPRKH